MGTVYDASYRSGVGSSRADRDVGDGNRRAAFIHQQPDTPLYEVSQLSNSDEDDDVSCDLEPAEYSPTMMPTGGTSMFSNVGYGAATLAKSVAQAGARLFYQQRQCIQMGEGPTLLRLLCFLGGFVMLTSSILSTINIFALLTSPSTYVLQMYQGFFGVVTMIVEAKNWDCFDHFKPWMTEWFRFLTVPAGKGAFYLFVGSLGVSLWLRNFFSFIVGLYMSFMGVVCIAVHAGNTWKPQYGIEDDHVYGNAVQRDDTLTAVFHDSEDHVYDERDGGAIVTATMRPDTTTTSSGHSLIPGGKKNGKRYAPHDSSTMSTMGMTTY